MLSINSKISPPSDCSSPREALEHSAFGRSPQSSATSAVSIAKRQIQESRLTDAKTKDTAKKALLTSTIAKANSVSSRFSPWLAALAYPLGRYVLLPFYFRRIEVLGREHLPTTGPVILAPTHRSRWDAFMVPYAAGQDITQRALRFMVTADEVQGIQGWFIKRLGGFAINTKHPTVASLRYSVDLLQKGEVLVIFPEGGDLWKNRSCRLNRLQPGLARLALQSEASQANLGIQIVPISISYSHPLVPWRCRVKICIGKPLRVADYCATTSKQSAKQLTADLENALTMLNDNTSM